VTGTRIAPVVCLGCGCACDDIAVEVASDRIAAIERACDLGRRWFGDGRLPARILVGGADAALDAATARVAALLTSPAMVYLAPELSTEAQRAAIALADAAGARLDSVTGEGGAPSIIAGQRRGRATATLAEIRRRADLIVFWGVDPAENYPRYRERYTRREAAVIAVDVGPRRGPPDARERVPIPPGHEATALGVMRAVVAGRAIPDLPRGLSAAAALAERLVQGRYVAIVHDAEFHADADPQLGEGLIGLAQALNVPTRCALSSLRDGGNRSGADAAITWQTGYPFAVDFSLGAPRYRPDESAADACGSAASVVVAGNAAALPAGIAASLAGRMVAVVGPRASETAGAEVAIDTGLPGVHAGGTAYRLDDVPLPLTPVLVHPRSADSVLGAVAAALAQRTAPR
jgi:formylmethanofuran dehydrogenase subunit B